MEDVEYITYRNGNDIDLGNDSGVDESGVIMMVLLAENRKQFIIQIFYEGSKAETGIAKHKLHINKIYHSYNANTNQAHKYTTISSSQEQQSQQ